MLKKDKKFMRPANSVSAHFIPLSHEQEYSIVRHDLYRVLALNSVYLVVILVLYFINRNSHFVDNFFAKILHF